MISQAEGTVDQLLKLLKLDNYAFYSFTCCKLQVLAGKLLSFVFCFVYILILKWEIFLATEFEVVYVITPFFFEKNAI